MSSVDKYATLGKTVVVIPTYNEALNIEWIIARLRKSLPHVDVMVMDDNSPDNTGEIVERIALTDSQVRVVHRTEKAGLGAAYRHGFRIALDEGYNVICQMDADGSHPPEQLHQLFDLLLAGADLAIGSRWVKGGSVVNWPLSRELLSRGGNTYIRLLLGRRVTVRDCTAGFRAFKRETLERIKVDEITVTGYVFQTALTWETIKAGLTIKETPIEFVERERGDSKMSGAVASESLKKVTVWGVQARKEQLKNKFKH